MPGMLPGKSCLVASGKISRLDHATAVAEKLRRPLAGAAGFAPVGRRCAGVHKDLREPRARRETAGTQSPPDDARSRGVALHSEFELGGSVIAREASWQSEAPPPFVPRKVSGRQRMPTPRESSQAWQELRVRAQHSKKPAARRVHAGVRDCGEGEAGTRA